MEVRWLLLSVSYAHLSRHTPPPEFTEWNAESVASVKQFGALASKMADCLHRMTHHVAGDVARRTARAYELLTGKRATPGGNRVSDERNEFERLLQKVYANLGIEASAEVHARKLVREKTKPK